MPTTIGFKFGDVVLVSFPFTDRTTAKKRPAVVVSSARYHRHRRDVIVMAVTSQLRPTSSYGEAAIERWKDAGLLKPSVFKPLLATLDRHLAIRGLGSLAKHDLRALSTILVSILGW